MRGKNWAGDVALDDIKIWKGACPSGLASTPCKSAYRQFLNGAVIIVSFKELWLLELVKVETNR